MKKLNRKSIMNNAWKMVKKAGLTISEALKRAWANAKLVAQTLANNATEEVHTWFGWKELGYEVIHESVNLFQIVVDDPTTKKGTRVLSYFGKSQVAPIEG